MKKAIHPKYHTKAKITCACGNEIEVGSTVEKIPIELCHLCHPFYTGQQKLVDTARRVEKFQEKLKKQTAASQTRKGKKAKNAARAEAKKTDDKKSKPAAVKAPAGKKETSKK